MGVMSRPAASTEALVLRCWPCGETSTIASLLTRDHGFVKVIAKGARGPRSQLRPLIEPGRLVNVEFSLDARRELQYLRGGGVDLDPLAREATLEKTAYLLGALELVDRCRPYEDFSHPGTSGADSSAGGPSDGAAYAGDLFEICGQFVRMLSSPSCRRPALLFFSFEWELLARHGITPEVAGCVSCGEEPTGGQGSPLRFSAADGGVVCGTCAGRDGVQNGRPLGTEALAYLREMARPTATLDEAAAGESALPRQMRRELGALLHGFLGYHLPGYRLPAALELLRAGKDSEG